MKLHAYLDVAGLLICSVYCTIPLFWLVFHPFVERWRKYGRKALSGDHARLGESSSPQPSRSAGQLRHLHLYESKVAWVMGALFILAGLSIYRSASQGFDRAKVSGLAELEPGQHEQRLVITGIRTQVRHPNLSWPPLRGHGLDPRHRIDCPLLLAGICRDHRGLHDSQGRRRTRGALWRRVSPVPR